MNLNGGRVTDIGLRYLKGLKQLEALSLFYNDKITDAGLGHLSGLDRLQELDLTGPRVTDAGLERIVGRLGKREGELTDGGALAHEPAV